MPLRRRLFRKYKEKSDDKDEAPLAHPGVIERDENITMINPSLNE